MKLERKYLERLLVDDLAQALCDSSSHMNLLPRAEQRPCDYHRKRAEDTMNRLPVLWRPGNGSNEAQ